MMRGHTQIVRFSREVEDGVEWFSAHWIGADASAVQERRHFPQVSRFRSWLVHDQGYGEQEADTLIEQLRVGREPRGEAQIGAATGSQTTGRSRTGATAWPRRA
jgi:hypothetical protein